MFDGVQLFLLEHCSVLDLLFERSLGILEGRCDAGYDLLHLFVAELERLHVLLDGGEVFVLRGELRMSRSRWNVIR